MEKAIRVILLALTGGILIAPFCPELFDIEVTIDEQSS